MGLQCLDFEKPIEEVQLRIRELKALSGGIDEDHAKELRRLSRRLKRLHKKIFGNLSRWQKAQLARHLDRPHTLDYIERILEPFLELHGDRLSSDDPAIVGGIGRLNKKTVLFVGHQKGRTIQEKVARNFGMPHPEGYRKAIRMMRLAERFGRPLITFIDTPGAYPGVGAEERGQPQAIATSLGAMITLRVPIVAVVIGEGGSGGALAIGVADRVLMMEHSIYSVISPEGCAAILWRDEQRKAQAAEVLKVTAQDAMAFGLVDEVIQEPIGGAHRDYQIAAEALKEALERHLSDFEGLLPENILEARYERYRRIGVFLEE